MEMKFYEKIGVRQWKKFVLWLIKKIIRNSDRKGNYFLEGTNLKSVGKFKKKLLFNGIVHAFGILLSIVFIVINIFKDDFISFYTLCYIIWFFINLYCIMLQRYNLIRIKSIERKHSQ